MPLETISKTDLIIQCKSKTPFFSKTIILFLSIFFTFSPTLAFASCCTCNHPQITAGQICITKELTSCNNLGSLNPDLKEATCTTETNATKCRLVKNGGICVNNPNTIVTSFKLSSLQPSSAPSGATATDSSSDFKPVLFKLNIDIPGTNFNSPSVQQGMLTVSYLNQYIQAFYKLLIGISLIAAAIMIIYGGFRYIMSATAPKIQTGKQIIIDALMGLVIVLGAYVVLVNVNPNLTQFGSLTMPFVEEIPLETLKPEVHKTASQSSTYYKGDENVTPQEVYDKSREIAAREGVDPCIVEAIIKTESGGKIGAIGHDENFALNFFRTQSAIPQSRVDFLRSRKFHSGKTFDSSIPIFPANCSRAIDGKPNPVYQECRKLAGVDGSGRSVMPLNDDNFDPSKPDYNLDKRYSHGFGISQLTIFPGTQWGARCDGHWSIKMSDTCFTAADLLTLEGGLLAIIKHPGVQKNKNNPSEAFWGYMGGGEQKRQTNKGLHDKKMAAYRQCAGK